MPTPTILAVHLSPTHTVSKLPQPSIHLLAGLGVAGDAHCGATVRHRYLRRRNPSAPNLTQVHLLAQEFLSAINGVSSLAPALLPGQLGENLTTRNLDLITLPLGTRLHLGASALVELTGLRTPCRLMDTLRPGLMQAAFLPGTRRPRAGVMAIVLTSGTVFATHPIGIEYPPIPHQPLRPI